MVRELEVYLGGEPPLREAEVLELPRALREMERCRRRGGRVVISIGDFDVGTEGQKRALDDSTMLEDRMEFVRRQKGVRWAVPVGKVNCRVIGERNDPNYKLYLEQCQNAEILLIHSHFPRISSATKEGRLRGSASGETQHRDLQH